MQNGTPVVTFSFFDMQMASQYESLHTLVIVVTWWYHAGPRQGVCIRTIYCVVIAGKAVIPTQGSEKVAKSNTASHIVLANAIINILYSINVTDITNVFSARNVFLLLFLCLALFTRFYLVYSSQRIAFSTVPWFYCTEGRLEMGLNLVLAPLRDHSFPWFETVQFPCRI